jgi:hypothetical protein
VEVINSFTKNWKFAAERVSRCPVNYFVSLMETQVSKTARGHTTSLSAQCDSYSKAVLVKLNVGGVLFATTLTTLTNVKGE